MISVFDSYGPGEEIPFMRFLRDRKTAKYLNRESMAAIAAVGRLDEISALPRNIPLYYSTGLMEYEDYGLAEIVEKSLGDEGEFSPERFVREGMAAVSPLNQFKVLQNMPVSFVSITFGFRGDNAVLYSSAGALVRQAFSAPEGEKVLIGAGKAWSDGRVECGFALAECGFFANSGWLGSNKEGIELLRSMAEGA